MRSIYVHSCIDDKGWFHIMLVRLNPIQPVSVIPGNDFVTSEVWCQLDLPGIFGCYSFTEQGAKLKSLSEICETSARLVPLGNLPLGKLQLLELSVSR